MKTRRSMMHSILKAKEQAWCPNNEKTCETEDARLPGHCLTATWHLALTPAPHPVGHLCGQSACRPLTSHLLMPSQLLWQLPSVTTNHSSSSRGISNISLLQHTVKSSCHCQSVRLKTMTWLWKCKIKDCTLSKPQINEAHYWSHKF